ncbi:hypothetical protein E2C01_056510 [Portunus trituberculatus]|uniref:Uncharacterized protein n=1 Tax=Portunus trituberculatus TaxID=210409 RepID=A0A5B7GYE0_PORTR|nr:hypothetical protein [Portunus trituberculatus]
MRRQRGKPKPGAARPPSPAVRTTLRRRHSATAIYKSLSIETLTLNPTHIGVAQVVRVSLCALCGRLGALPQGSPAPKQHHLERPGTTSFINFSQKTRDY